MRRAGRTIPHSYLLMMIAAAMMLVAASIFAQSTTSSIRGKVTNPDGKAVAGAEVDAVGVASGFVSTAVTRDDGSFVLSAVTPGGYNLIVTARGFEVQTEAMTVLLGQTIDVDVKLSPSATLSQTITVTGAPVVDTKTPEASTNVTPREIESLPQDDRNFLNFAQLAPGIRLSTDPLNKTFAGDAQPADETNIYIDGVSFKNDVLPGGSAGQNSSRGNPFPQNAVQEFRVITQNYSAQYEKASSAIITAVTKSGSNKFDGQVFLFYQPKGWVAATPSNFQFSTLATNQSYKRYQSGLSLGGPIVRSKLNYFFSYEGDKEDATTEVNINPAFPQFASSDGFFPSPFKSTLGFGKLSWQPVANQLLDFSGNYRFEHETRDFGGTTSFQSGTDLTNSVDGGTLRDQWNNAESLNQATVSLQAYHWDPTPLNPDLVGLDYQGVIRLGGNSTTQRFDQRRLELKDDYTYTGFHWMGDHSLQIGGNADAMHYNVDKNLFGNPQYEFRQDLGFATPFQVNYGFGNPQLSSSNNEFGIYGEDNWTVNEHLLLNLGLRWDYESNELDTNYRTPANVVADLTGLVDSSYFANGHDRPPAKNEFQPRLGLSYDIMGDGKSVIYGGAGRYYDRLYLNAGLDERFRLQFPTYLINFSNDGLPRDGQPTILWNDSYFTAAGLNALIAQGTTNPQIFLLNNNTSAPYSNQYNIGFRQTFGGLIASASYNGVRGYHGFTWRWATGVCCGNLSPDLGQVLLSTDTKRYWYDGEYLTLDRPYTVESKWGARFAWTHAKATQTGNDLFSLDYPTPADYPRHLVPGTERDRIVITGIVGLPFDTRFSTLISLGSGQATPVDDCSAGFGPGQCQPFDASVFPKKTWGFADRSVDLRLEKDIRAFGPTSVALVAEGFNVFNFHNYGCLDGFQSPPPGNSNFGNAGCVIDLGRRLQAGVRLGF